MTTYWFSNICVLFGSLDINPFVGKDRNFKYNALTRLIILVSIIIGCITRDYLEVLIAGLVSIVLSLIIYFISFNKDYLYSDADQILTNMENNDFKNSTNLEKIKLEDEKTNKKNTIISKHTKDLNTKSLANVFFIETPDINKDETMNSEKYNLQPTKNLVLGSKVINDILKKDIRNEYGVADLTEFNY
jgi:hypothetical protein